MVVVNAMANGQAPAGLSKGDFVNTNGGMYAIANPGEPGAVYNPASGYWSYKTDSDDYRIMAMMNSAQEAARQNTMTSQDFAREQMAFQNSSAQKAMQFSADQAQLNREWQERMSSSAHQREVLDLIAAGLNPILSAGGSGATTPSGSAASGVASSGASGSVDTGGTSAAAQLLSTLLNNRTSLEITRLQTLATMYAADQGLVGTQYNADTNRYNNSLNARNQQYLLHKTQEYDDYVHREYPDTNHVIGGAINALTDFLTTTFTGISTGKHYSDMAKAWYDLGIELAEQYADEKASKSPKAGILNYVLNAGEEYEPVFDRAYERAYYNAIDKRKKQRNQFDK